MQKNSFYFLLSGVISFAVYLSLILFILTYLTEFSKKSKQYTAKKNSFIEITMKENKKSVIKKKIAKKKSTKKIAAKKTVKKVLKTKKTTHLKKTSKPTKKTKSLKSLFSSVDTNKYRKDHNLTEKSNLNSRIPKKSTTATKKEESTKKFTASNLTKSLSLEDTSTMLSKRNGEYNAYIGKISDMLDSKWQETPGTIPGNNAKVIVRIDKFGNFSYKIDTLSYNNEFNAKLESFLESLKNEKFPPYKNGDYIEIKVNFKDE